MEASSDRTKASTRGSRGDWWQDAMLLSRQNGFWILLILIALAIVFSLATPTGTFLSVFNLQTLMGDASELLILASGALLVIVAGGIDLSTGSVMTLAGAVSYLTMKGVGADQGWLAIGIGIVAGVAAGAGWGTINGFLVAYARIPAFVVTLGSLGAALAVARLLLKGGSFASIGPPQFSSTLGTSKLLGVPVPFVIAAVLVLVLGIILAKTRFGEHVYLVGSNQEGARRGGVAVERTQVKVYLLSGAIAGVAGMVDFARFNSVDIATGHTPALIASIAAVIIGGASLNGGIGAMPGTVVAVSIPVVLNNGLVIMGVEPFWQDIAVGAILVAAVGFDQWRRGGGSLRTAALPPVLKPLLRRRTDARGSPPG